MNSNLSKISSIINSYSIHNTCINKHHVTVGQDAIDLFKKGNKIYIKKANRGKFTEYCGGKVTQECINRGKNSSNPKIRKRATFAANARKWKHQDGGVITQEDKDILWTLNDIFGANSSTDKYFKYWDFKKGDTDASNFFNSYLKSKGVERILNNQNTWWEKRHPYRKWYSNSDQGTKKWLDVASKTNPYFYDADMYPEQSAVYTIPNYKHRVIITGRRDNKEFPYNFTVGHEFAHGKAPFTLFGPLMFHNKSAQQEALDQNTNTNKGHDSKWDEKHADNWRLKYLLYKEGIYDARDDKDITIEQVQQLRQLYPELRPFKQMSDEEIQFQINNVAHNKVNKREKLV